MKNLVLYATFASTQMQMWAFIRLTIKLKIITGLHMKKIYLQWFALHNWLLLKTYQNMLRERERERDVLTRSSILPLNNSHLPNRNSSQHSDLARFWAFWKDSVETFNTDRTRLGTSYFYARCTWTRTEGFQTGIF